MKRKRRRKMGFQFLLSACAVAGAVMPPPLQQRRAKRRAQHHAPNACIGRKRRSFRAMHLSREIPCSGQCQFAHLPFRPGRLPGDQIRSPRAHSGRSQDRSLPEEVFRGSETNQVPLSRMRGTSCLFCQMITLAFEQIDEANANPIKSLDSKATQDYNDDAQVYGRSAR